MKAVLPSIAERRQRLISRAAEQRLVIAQNFEPCRRPLVLADHLLSITRVLKRHPGWLLVGSLALAALPQSRLGGWLARGWAVGRVGYLLLASRTESEKRLRS